jgi:hypothetical protein
LFKRDESGLSRVRRAHSTRERARNLPTHLPRFAIEELEHRVLLASIPGLQPAPYFAAGIPLGIATVSPLPPQMVSASANMQTAGLLLLSGPIGGNSSSLALVDSTAPGATNSSLSYILDPHASEAGVTSSVITGSGTAAGLAGWGYANLASAKWSLSTSPDGVTQWPVKPDFDSDPVIPIDAGAGLSPAMSFVGRGVPSDVPIAVQVQIIKGMIDSDHPYMWVPIPVGPNDQAMELSVHSTSGQPGESPAVAQVDLESSTGAPLAQYGPGNGTGPLPSPTVTAIIKNAPAGGQLDVQIGATSSGSTELEQSSLSSTAATTSSSQTSNWSVSFVLDIQRQELSNVAQATTSSVQAGSVVGTLVGATAPQNGPLVSSSSEPSLADQNGTTSAQDELTTTAVVSQTPATAEGESEPLESFNVRLSTGPLASRSASPLGPTIASIDADATQPVDRHERALSQEIDGLGSDDEVQSAAWRSRGTDQEPLMFPGRQSRSAELLGEAEPVVAVTGRGGFPIKVTSTGRGQHARLTDLWATLPSEADLAGSEPGFVQVKISASGEAPFPITTDRPADLMKYPDYVKAAFGLFIGMSLTSGPLFPDLMASLPRHIPRWIMVLRPPARKTNSAATQDQRLRPIRTWLRGLLVRTARARARVND